jgi:hypothetical protein
MRKRKRASLEATDTDGDGLRIGFDWHDDRYAHKIFAAAAGRLFPVLESIEGSDQDDWPASPPLQQLSIEELRPGVSVALLVGMAGKSHWSVSIEPTENKTGFIFDVACRLKSDEGRLLSSYRRLVPEMQSADSGFQIETESSTIALRGLPIEGAMPLLHDDGSTLRFKPEEIGARTTRWKYCVEVVDRS